MLKGESILCFAPDPWDDIWRNRHQIMSLLSEANRILYVEPRPYLRPVMRQVLGREIKAKDLVRAQISMVNEGLSVFHPPLYAPLCGRPPLSILTDALRAATLRRAMRKLDLEHPILWLFRPDMADVPGRYDERLLVYHIVDEYTGYADLATDRAADIRRRENELITRADLVLVTSRALLESKGGVNPNTHWVPNGVAYKKFAAAAAKQATPEAIGSLAHPRIGYVGAINDKIDTGLLLRVADAYPKGSIVLVGPVRPVAEETREGLATLRTRSNVHFVGRVPVDEVPDYAAACDVGLLPYRRNAWTQHIHPLKLHEYLACGLPVVATDIPSTHDERDVIHVAGDAAEFVRAVGEVVRGDSQTLRSIRQARAANNTWTHRVERISELVEAALREKGTTRGGLPDRRIM